MITLVQLFLPTLVRACKVNQCWNACMGVVVLSNSYACLQATPGWICLPRCGCYCRLSCVPTGNTGIDMLAHVQLSRRLSCVIASSTGIDMLACVPHFSSRCLVVVVTLLLHCCCVVLLLRCCCHCHIVVMVPSKVLQQSFLIFDVKRCCSTFVLF